MKKILIFIWLLGLIVIINACQEDFEPGGTAVEEMAGTYTVLYNHSVYGTDAFGVGFTQVLLYNTSDNSTAHMWLSDEGAFWDYRVKIPIDLNSMNFGSSDTVVSVVDGYDIKVLVRNGKIIKNGTTPASGLPVDSIYFELWFEDLEEYGTGIANDTLFVSGYRYTGWPEDE